MCKQKNKDTVKLLKIIKEVNLNDKEIDEILKNENTMFLQKK